MIDPNWEKSNQLKSSRGIKLKIWYRLGKQCTLGIENDKQSDKTHARQAAKAMPTW